jgi:hypothetical protein
LARPTYVTSAERAIGAVFVGAFVGGSSLIGEMIAPSLFESNSSGGATSGDVGGIGILFFAIAVASIGFGIGIIVVGVPAWLFLHRRGRRNWYHAALLGIALGFVATSFLLIAMYLYMDHAGAGGIADTGGEVMLEGRFTAHGWWSIVKAALYVTLAACPAALIVWRIAYRKVTVREA